MANKMNQLRAPDAEIVKHVIERGKMLERRQKLVESLRGTPGLKGYQAELLEWLESVKERANG